MNILFCINSLGAFGGMERVTIVKANALADIEGNNVAICYTDKGSFPQKIIHPLSPKVKTYDLDTPYWKFDSLRKLITGFIPQIFRTRKRILQVVADFKPDVLITYGAYERFAVAMMSHRTLKNAIGGGKTLKIREFHFASIYRTLKATSTAQKLMAKVTEFFEYHIVSRFFDKSFLLTFGDKKDNFNDNPRFDVMYNPLSFSHDFYDPDAEREKVVLAVGRVCYEKNYQDLIRIWAEVSASAPGWKLRIVGNGDMLDSIRDLAKDLGVEESVELPGYSSDVQKEMSRASIFAMTSRYEGLPLVIAEAQFAGLPMVSYDTKYGPEEITNDGMDSFIVPQGNREMFKNRLLELIQDSERRREMGEMAHRNSLRFSMDKIAAQWMEKYESLLAELK